MSVESVPLKPETFVFYPLRKGVLVTDSWFCADRHRFAVSGLDEIWERDGGIQPCRRAALEVIWAEAVLALVVVAVFTVTVGPSRLLYGLAGLDLGFALALAALSSYRWPRSHELWGNYQGRPTLLFASPEKVEFHKVCRAARRAIDHRLEQSD
jgi:hypothetical protein